MKSMHLADVGSEADCAIYGEKSSRRWMNLVGGVIRNKLMSSQMSFGFVSTEPSAVGRLTLGKVLVALILIALGSTLVFASVAGFFVIQTSPTAEKSVAGTSITMANTTVALTDFTTEGGSVGIAWEAAAQITVYVLNQSQFLNFKQAHPQPYFYFEGLPAQWVYLHTGANGSVSTSTSRGQFYILASATSPATVKSVLVSYRASIPPQPPSNGLQIVTLLPYALILGSGVVGALLVVLGAVILTKRVSKV